MLGNVKGKEGKMKENGIKGNVRKCEGKGSN